MRTKLICILGIMILAFTLPGISLTPGQASAKSVSDLAIFKAAKFDAHYRVPNEAQIELMLKDEGIISPADAGQNVRAHVQAFMKEWVKRNPSTPNPQKLESLLKFEKLAKQLAKHQDKVVPESPIKSLAVPVEFIGTDTFTYNGTNAAGNCELMEVTTSGPLHNQIPPPGPRDNNTLWYQDATPALYNEMYFGVGPNAGIIVTHPNLGTVDLRGKTMANYYLEQSGGKFLPAGMVYGKWLQASHSEGWYGADECSTGNHNIRAHLLVTEVVDLLNADNPSFAWQDYDGNGDGIVDNFTVIHAGMGQEGGGGLQGDLSIWSHASLINYPIGYKACTAGSAGCPTRDIFVREYSMDPENIDLGVISEEFGHAAFGLPDMYTTDAQMSLSNWAIMEAGSWNGILGGTEPAPFPLWFRYLVGWTQPYELDYTTKPAAVIVGQLSKTPAMTESGIKINLPDKSVTVPNPLGTGQAWWSNVADLANNTLTRGFDLTGAAAPIFSFASSWSIEADYDYGYVEVSTDGGATWVTLPDMDGILTNTNPSGQNAGWGLTGEGTGTLRFNLAAYVGQSIMLRLRYTSDMGVQWNGWWADDIALVDGAATIFSDDVETGANGWTAVGWTLVPVTNIYPRYYLVEWRNNSGFDQGLKYPYQTVYSDDDEWEVDRAPYTVPGMLVYFRDASYRLDYALLDSLYDPPSWGPKHGIILVDSHPFPYMWDAVERPSGAHLRTSARVQPADAAFTLQDTKPFTLRLGYDPITGAWLDTPFATQTFGPRPAVKQFHDSLGYYPGIFYNPTTHGLYFWQADASMAVPAQDSYTTRITDLNYEPLYDLYGADIGTILGSGNPGDNNVQYGLHIAPVYKAKDGRWAAIMVWNSQQLVDLDLSVSPKAIKAGRLLVYKMTLKNQSPIPQHFALHAAMPANTTYVMGRYYDRATNSIMWEGTIPPQMTLVSFLTVKVNRGVAPGTVISNTTTLLDDALGDTATVTVTVEK